MATLQKSREELAEQIKQKTEEAEKLGRSTVDSEMLRAEIKNLEVVQAKMAEHARRAEVWRLAAARRPARLRSRGEELEKITRRSRPNHRSCIRPPKSGSS